VKEQRVEAVERALSIIECFSREHVELSLAQLSEETGLYKSTILRLCGSLERYGYIVRKASGHFRIGPSLWRLGSLYSRSFEQSEIIRPELKRLVDETKETASFYVQDANDRICLYREVSPHSLRFDLDEGARLPMDKGAAAHVLRAYSGHAQPENSAIRSVGYALSDSDRTPQVAAVAVPVFDKFGGFRGAIGLSGPSFRFDQTARERALDSLKAAASRLCNQ
jgi:DNA-binding IclR family transcriptional regulator